MRKYTISCVMFIFCCFDYVVLMTLSLHTTINIGIMQRWDSNSAWTNSTLLHNALEQLSSDDITNNSIHFKFEYISKANLSSVNGCFDLVCGTLAPRKLKILITSFDNHETQLLTRCAGLARIAVIGTSRSISFQNKKKYPNYNSLFPSLLEEIPVLHSIVDSIWMDEFAIVRGDDEDSTSVTSSFISTIKTAGHSDKFFLFNLTKDKGVVSTKQTLYTFERIRRLSIKVIVLICDDVDAQPILQASLEARLHGRDRLWIGTERVLRYVQRVTNRLLPENLIAMQLRVLPEETALRAAQVLHKMGSQKELISSATADLCTSGFYSTYIHTLSAAMPSFSRNTTYDIIERTFDTTAFSSNHFQTASTWSRLTGFKTMDFLNRYKEFASKTQRVRIVTIEHGQYTYQVTKTYPKCAMGVSHCKQHDQTCEIGVPATRYYKSNDTYKPERICIAGLMIQLLYLIKDDLKFEHDLYIVKDGKYGGVDKTGKWNGMIGDLLQGEADMALATLTTTRKRLQVVDFSSPFGEVGIGLLTSASSDGLNQAINTDFIKPFTSLLWTVIFITVAIVLSLIWLLDKVSWTWYFKNRYARVFKKRIRFLESMSFVWSTFVHVSAGSGLPRSESSRFVALFFAFAMIILSASYTAELAARKVKEEVAAPISGIFDEKMLNPPEGFRFATLKDSSTEAFFKFSEDPRMRQIYNNMKDYNVVNLEDGVKKLVNGEFQVYIDDRPYLEHLVSSRLNCSLRVVDDSLGTSGYAVALTKNSKWTSPLSLAILKYSEANILQDLWSKWLKRKCTRNDEFTKGPSGLAEKDLNGLFLALLIGTGFGMAALAFENGMHYLRNVHAKKGVKITDKILISRDAGDVVAISESLAHGVRLVSHFSNGGFDGMVGSENARGEPNLEEINNS